MSGLVPGRIAELFGFLSFIAVVACACLLTVSLHRSLPLRLRPLSLPVALIVSIPLLMVMWTIVEVLRELGL